MTEFALSLGNAVSDQPFNDDFFTAVLRYAIRNRKKVLDIAQSTCR